MTRRVGSMGGLMMAAALMCAGAAFAQFEKAERFLARSEINGALAEYLRLTETDPPEPRAFIRVAQIMLLANEIERAEAYARLAVEADPNSARAALLIMSEAHRRTDALELAAAENAELGNTTRADLYASFKGQKAYDIVGGAKQSELRFVESEPIPIVSIRVNGGDPILCAIDTTEAELVLNTGPAIEYGVETFGQLELKTVDGEPIVRTLGKASSVTLGNFEVKNVPVSIGSTKAKSDLFEKHRVDGIIGTSLLSRFRFTMDYPAKRLVVERRSTRRTPHDDESVARFMLAGDRYLVSAGDANHRGPYFFVIQLGTPDLIFGPSKEVMMMLDPRWSKGARQIRQVRLGRVVEPDALATPGAFSEALGMEFGFRIDGAVADDFLRTYVITFDFDRMELIIRKDDAEDE